MKNRSNIYWGAFLIAFGFLFLGISNDWFSFESSLKEIAKFWPLMIVLAGVAVFFHPQKTLYNPTTALLIAFAIPLAMYNATSKAYTNIKETIDDDFNIDINTDDDDDDSTGKNSSGKFTQNFNVAFDDHDKAAKLELGGGAAEFHLQETPANALFMADTKMFGSKFKLEDEQIGGVHQIVFNMNSKNNSDNIQIGKGMNNDIYLKLNKKPIWDLDLNIGAGNLEFDLSDYKIKNIDASTGAANLSLKLGSLMPDAKVKIESGVAKITIKVPKASACEIEMDGALNAKDFEGFTENNGIWKTENFNSAKNKIHLKIESGLSAVNVERY